MPPIWPFKKKAALDEPIAAEVMEYQRGDDGKTEATLTDRSHVEGSDFQDAMFALSQPHIGTPEAGQPVASTEVVEDIPLPKSKPDEQWVQNTDGYWYKKKADGSFESTAYVENSSGEKVPYSS